MLNAHLLTIFYFKISSAAKYVAITQVLLIKKLATGCWFQKIVSLRWCVCGYASIPNLVMQNESLKLHCCQYC